MKRALPLLALLAGCGLSGGGGGFSGTLNTGTLTMGATTSTNTITCATDADTASATVAACTMRATAAINSNALLYNVEKSDGTNMFTVDLEGDVVTPGFFKSSAHVFTIADNGAGGAASGTLQPTSNFVLGTCSDANGCDVTMGETGPSAGLRFVFVNSSANVFNFSDSATTSELGGAFACGQYDSIEMMYIADRWVEVARSNN